MVVASYLQLSGCKYYVQPDDGHKRPKHVVAIYHHQVVRSMYNLMMATKGRNK